MQTNFENCGFCIITMFLFKRLSLSSVTMTAAPVNRGGGVSRQQTQECERDSVVLGEGKVSNFLQIQRRLLLIQDVASFSLQ